MSVGQMEIWTTLRQVAGQPVQVEPVLFSLQGFTPWSEWPKDRPANRTEIGPPLALVIGFDVAGPLNGRLAQLIEINGLLVHALHLAGGTNDKLHHATSCWALRKLHQTHSVI